MDTKFEYLTDTKARIKVAVPNVEILPEYVKALEKANIAFNGNPLIKKGNQYSEFVKRDVCNEFIKRHFNSALKKLAIEPISKVSFEHENWDEKQDFHFSATFEVRPRLSRIQFSGLNKLIDIAAISVTDDMIANALENIRMQQQTFTLLPQSAVAGIGYHVVVDVEAFVDGLPLPQASANGFYHELSNANADTPLQKNILGKKVGDEVEFNFHYPKDFQDVNLASKEVHFKVKLVEIRVVKRPEITDDFVKTMFGNSETINSVSALKKHLIDNLQFTLEQQQFQSNKAIILKTLVEQNPFDIPKQLLQKQFETLIDFEVQEYKKSHSPAIGSKLDLHINSKRTEILAKSEFLVRCALVVDAFARQFRLANTPADLEMYFQKFARLRGTKVDHVRKTLQNPKLKPQVAYTVLEDKVVEHLIRIAKPETKVS